MYLCHFHIIIVFIKLYFLENRAHYAVELGRVAGTYRYKAHSNCMIHTLRLAVCKHGCTQQRNLTASSHRWFCLRITSLFISVRHLLGQKVQNPSGLRDDQKQPYLPFANSQHLIMLGLKVIKKRLTYSEHTWLRCSPPHHTVPDPQITHQLLATHTPPDHVHFTLHEVREVVHVLNNRKSPGPDLVTPKMLKELPKKGLLTLLYIFNGILRTHHWPAALKTAEIILLLKSW